MSGILGGLAVAVGIVALVPYWSGLVRGTVRPNPWSWLAWGIGSLFVLVIQVAEGAGPGAWTTVLAAVSSLGIAAVAFRRGAQRVVPVDVVAFATSVVAMIAWTFLRSSDTSMILLTAAELVAIVPTIRSVQRDPRAESPVVWTLFAGKHVLSTLAVASWSIATVLNPAAWAVAELSVVVLILAQRRTAALAVGRSAG